MGGDTSIDAGRVLVVDDDPLNRKLLEKSLQRLGHEVSIVTGGKECLETLSTTEVDVVLLDILMPDLDGFEVLGRMKDDPSLRHIPVVMISGLEDVESVVRCIELGADDFLPKPFDPVILRARVNSGMNRVRLHRLERDRVRDVFARFLPETVVDDALKKSGDDLRLGGERLVGTVMFTDLRGFTSFAEARPAERVIDVLNRYLGDMGGAVLDHGGTLVDYMGDGIMAAFGAPIESEDHADRAVAAAREMVTERLPAFNAWLAAQGLGNGFAMGIGVNTGPVMSGNVGSERRLEYTALGDTTNTAARLEGMTKGTPHQLFVADSTRDALTRPADDLVEVGEFEVRGRKATIKLWSLADPEQPPATEPTPARAQA
jgi:adenylate cyclase